MIVLHIFKEFSFTLFVLMVLVLHPYIFTKIFWKIYESKCCKKDFLSSFYADFPFLYIHEYFLKSLWKQLLSFKLFCYSYFPFLYMFMELFRKNYENKVLHLGKFSVISSLFGTQILSSNKFMKTFWKNYENKMLYLSNF